MCVVEGRSPKCGSLDSQIWHVWANVEGIRQNLTNIEGVNFVTHSLHICDFEINVVGETTLWKVATLMGGYDIGGCGRVLKGCETTLVERGCANAGVGRETILAGEVGECVRTKRFPTPSAIGGGRLSTSTRETVFYI